jgi:hypothetical protein
VPQKQIRIDGLLGLAKYGADISVWPLGTGAAEHADKTDRVSLALYTGCATLHLSPTASEVRALIAALEWAIGVPTVDEAAALERRRASMVADLESRFAEVAL